MIAVDTNILVYAFREELPENARARAALRLLVEGPAAWAIPWSCVHEFLGVVTNPRLFREPSPAEFALGSVDDLCAAGNLTLLSETVEHRDALRRLVLRGRVFGPVIHDARIAAVCLSHGVSELWTADRDFARFPDLKTRNPLL